MPGRHDVLRDSRRHETHRRTSIFRVEENGAAERVVVGHLRRPRLAVDASILTANHVTRTREEADQPVARAVDEHRGFEPDQLFGPHLPACDEANGAVVLGAVRLDVSHVGVEEQGDVLFGADEVKGNVVPQDWVSLGIAPLVL